MRSSSVIFCRSSGVLRSLLGSWPAINRTGTVGELFQVGKPGVSRVGQHPTFDLKNAPLIGCPRRTEGISKGSDGGWNQALTKSRNQPAFGLGDFEFLDAGQRSEEFLLVRILAGQEQHVFSGAADQTCGQAEELVTERFD